MDTPGHIRWEGPHCSDQFPTSTTPWNTTWPGNTNLSSGQHGGHEVPSYFTGLLDKVEHIFKGASLSSNRGKTSKKFSNFTRIKILFLVNENLQYSVARSCSIAKKNDHL